MSSDTRKTETDNGRRSFLKVAGIAGLGAMMTPLQAAGQSSANPGGQFSGQDLQVWSCGGLAESLIPACKAYEQRTGAKVAYTGAFAAALGKSLMASATTDVFAGRVLDLAKNLRKADKMVYFKPLCFTEYVLVVPKGNPADIQSVQDLGRPGVKVVLAPEASPPGGPASLVLLKKAGVKEAALNNAIVKGSCVQMVMPDLISGKGDVSVMERRLVHLPMFAGKVDTLDIPAQFQPPPPLTFTIGVMKSAQNRKMADDYVEFICSAEGQSYFTKQGFISAYSAQGLEMTERLGVKDV